MNIMWLTPDAIYPPHGGGHILVYNRIKYLSANNNIYLFVICNSDKEKYDMREMEKYCKCVYIYNRKNKYINFLRSTITPYHVTRNTLQIMAEDMVNCIKIYNIELINIDQPFMLKNCFEIYKQFPSIPLVVNQQNIENRALKSIAKSMAISLKKYIMLLESIKMMLFENRYYNDNYVSVHTFVSSEDKQYFENTYKKSNTITNLSPIGGDILSIDQKIYSHRNIVFTGSMNYPPSIEGIAWFRNNIFTEIQKEVPEVVLYIVGKEPTKEVFSLGDDNVFVTGRVDDIQPYYDLADIIVVPILSGGGVKVKFIEAISRKKIIVTTSKGIEGTTFNTDHVLLADDPATFAEACITALKKPGMYESMIERAYDKFKSEYSWDSICKDYEFFLNTILYQKR